MLGLASSASWRDGYVTASFRGIKFFINRSNSTGGRKLVKHEFPEKDDTYNEDLGRKNKEFNLSAYLIGDEYYNKRNDLEDALDKKGPGVLIHPYRGELNVVVDDFSIGEETEEGRMCRFDIQFVLDGEVVLTVLGPGPYDLLNDAIADFQAAALSHIGDVYDIVNAPNEILNDIASVVNVGLSIVEASMTLLNTDDTFMATLENLQNNIETLVLSPTQLFSEMQELISYGTDTTNVLNDVYTQEDAGAELFANMKSITDFQDTNYSQFPTVADIDGAPAKEAAKFMSRTSLGARAGLVSSMTIDNANEADDIMSELDAVIVSIEEDELISDDLYAAARDLRVALKGIIEERKLNLSELTDYETTEFKPGITLSYDLYKDVTRDEEIAELNGILHPGFIPAGVLTVEEE